MRKTHLKFLACLLALLLLMGTLCGCISVNAENAPSPTAEQDAQTVERLPLDRSKIIISVWGYTEKVAESEEGAQSLKEFGTDRKSVV